MADYNRLLQLMKDTNAEVALTGVEPSNSLATIKEDNRATAALNLIKTTNSIIQQPEPKTYEDLAKIVRIQTQAPPAYEPMGTMEYLGKKAVGLVEQPFYAIGEGSAAALETGAKMVGLKKIAKYFKESKEMWKTPPITKDVNDQFAWLLESAKKKSTMHGMVVEMAEIGVQIGSLLIQVGLLGKVPGVKALDLSVFKGTAPLKAVTRQMGTMFAHGVATTPGDLSTRFQAGVTRMAYNMTPYIANWTGATGWGARLVDTALNTFLTSPSYIKSMKAAKNPMEFIMMAMPQFMTDVIFALNTTGTPMNQRLKAMGARPVVFGQKLEEKTAFLKGVDKAIAETERPYGEEAPEPTKQQVVDSAISKAKVKSAEDGVLAIHRERTIVPKFPRSKWAVTDKESLQRLGDAIAAAVGLGGKKIHWYVTVEDPKFPFKEAEGVITAATWREGVEGLNEIEIIVPRGRVADTYSSLSAAGKLLSGKRAPSHGNLVKVILHELGHLAAPARLTAAGRRKEVHGKVFHRWTQDKAGKLWMETPRERALVVSKIPTKRITAGEKPAEIVYRQGKLEGKWWTPDKDYAYTFGKTDETSKRKEVVSRYISDLKLIDEEVLKKQMTAKERTWWNWALESYKDVAADKAYIRDNPDVKTPKGFIKEMKYRLSTQAYDTAEAATTPGDIRVLNALNKKLESFYAQAAFVGREVKKRAARAKKAEILEFLGRQPEGALIKSKLKPGKITVGEHPGMLVTKTEHKKRLALSKKAVQEAKMDELVAPINKGKKLSEYDKVRVVTENRDFWEKIKYGLTVWHLGNMRPERMLERIDGFGQGPNTKLMYGKIHEAAGGEIVGVTKDTDAQNAAITRLGFMPDVDRFYVDRKFIGDTRWQLSKNEMVEIYKNMQNPKAIKHLTKAKALNGMGFSKTDLAAIKAEVEADPQMKGLADWQIAEYKTWYKRVAPIYFMETGKVLPMEAYYSPIMVQKEFLDFEKENFAQEIFDRYHIDGYIEKGFTKARKDGATQPIKLDAIGNHLYNIRRMQHYVNFALPLKEFRAVINHPRWRNAVETQLSPTFYKNIKKYYDAVAGTKPAGADEVANKVMGFLRTNAGTAMLGFNILTAMRQPLSAFQATAEISLLHMLSAIRQIGLDPAGLEKFVYERSKMVKYRRGQFERFMTETEVSLPELLGKPRAPKAITGRLSIRDRAMGMAIFMDKNTVLCTWKAAYDKVTQTGKTLDGEKIPTKDLEKAACMEADLAVRRTQPMATVKDLPAWHRSSSWLKMFTMFQNQINNNYNYFAHDIIGKAKAGKITPYQAAQKTLFAYVLPAMLLGMISRGGLPKNKKQLAEDMIAFPTSGLFFAGGIINSMIKGYSNWGVPPLQFAPDLVKAYTSKTWATKGKFGLKGLAEVSGIPYNQLARTWKGMQALMAGETDDYRRLIWSAYSLEKGLPKKVKGGVKVFKRKE